MICENRLCVYWKQNSCALREVHLDGQGSCTDCIIVELPEELIAVLVPSGHQVEEAELQEVAFQHRETPVPRRPTAVMKISRIQ